MRGTELHKARQEWSDWCCCSSDSAKWSEEVLTPCRGLVVLIVSGISETLLSLETLNIPWGSGTRFKMLTELWSSCLCAFSRAGMR